ncbi:CatB-related O-acetyltransferase [Pseudoalteromonas shioyasakiensis]|uniref:CatB-related O-acetyltransferase n=1 Tax=Pseudoalteromonas shioyasakiensis TaxID=1190813 RepID=UPI0023D92FF0|nr:CatB-related O-acetyltransferase [Pseudoalteromonas shioyasakiensis]
MTPQAEVKESSIHESVKLYNYVTIFKSQLSEKSSVGDFSKVVNSTLFHAVRIDRNNHIDNSQLGVYSYTGRNTLILHSVIGRYTSISWNVSIGGANHDYSRVTQHSFLYNSTDNIRPPYEESAYNRFENSVVIGSDVWIAAGAVITRGVEVGDGAVVGANAVVTKDVPPYAIVAGNPAKVIKYRFPKETIEILLKIKWWDWPVEKIRENYSVISQSPDIEKLKKLT